MARKLERGRRPPGTIGCPATLAALLVLFGAPVVLIAGFVVGLIAR